MSESWREQMYVGLVHFMAFPNATEKEPLLDSVRYLAKDDFWDVIEVKRSEEPGVHQALKELAEQAGMKIGVGAQPWLLTQKLSLNDPDEAGRKAAIDEVKKSIDAAYEMDARIVAVLTGKDPGPAERDHQLDLLVDSLTQLCKYSQEKAQDYVAWISVETFDYDVDKACLLGPTDRAADCISRVKAAGVSNIGLTIDLSHLPMLREDYAECLSLAAEHLIHVHVGNCVCADPALPGYGDLHPRFEYPGGENGVNELRLFLEALTYVGYFRSEVPTPKPIVTFEVKPMPGEDSEIVLAQTKRIFRRAWAAMGTQQ
jgi:sugar phosphate isomerase/epimerase